MTRALHKKATVGVLVAVLTTAIPFAAAAAEVTLNLKVERKPVVLFKGEPRPVNALIEAMAKKNVGWTEFTIRVQPRPYYQVAAAQDSSGLYRIDPNSLQLTTSATVNARIVIRAPKLSEAQFRALRNTGDYRLVYGLIRGIVEHEELHAREFARHARKARTLYAAPPLGRTPEPIVDPNGDAGAVFARYVTDRAREGLNVLEASSAAAQRRIDHTGKKTEILFRFADPVNDEIPDPIIYTTEGKLRVIFSVPKGNPRPPEPKTKY